MKTVLYPSPLHYKQVPALIRDTKATLLLRPTLFCRATREPRRDDLKSVRVVVCGAERVKEADAGALAQVGNDYPRGLRRDGMFTGHCLNLPHNNTPGTVGALLPGIEARLEPVEGIAEGGRLMVRGPNVMKGYMLARGSRRDRAARRRMARHRRHRDIDQRGLVAIKGGAKRFAKIGGEMVSLAAVETMVASLWPDANHVVVSHPRSSQGRTARPRHRQTRCGQERAPRTREVRWLRRALGAARDIGRWSDSGSRIRQGRSSRDNGTRARDEADALRRDVRRTAKSVKSPLVRVRSTLCSRRRYRRTRIDIDLQNGSRFHDLGQGQIRQGGN